VLERSFPLLESALRGGGGDGATPAPQATDGNGQRGEARPAAPTGLDALLGGGDVGSDVDDED
jgi:DNA-directed RNA polymerase subunit beta'